MESIASEQRVALGTGIDGLDQVLAGGFTADRLYLIEGDPGAGKTTLGLQFLLAGVAKGESGLYITLSETKEELLAMSKSHGWSLDGISLFELIPSGASLEHDAQYQIFHPAEAELSETTKSVLAEVERVKPARVVFDSLSDMRMLAQDPLRYRRQIIALKHFFAGRKCTVLLLDDRSTNRLDLQLQSLAHGVLSLEQLSPEYGAERRRLRVVKMRGMKYRGGFHDFTIQRGGLRLYPRLVAADHHAPFEREDVGSGVQGLDSLLGGGLRRGTSTLVIGPAGSGKSSIALQYAAAAARRGEHAALFIFDETRASLTERATGLRIADESLLNGDNVSIQQIDPAELSPGEFAQTVRDAVESRNARVVVIDSLNGYLHAMPSETFLTLHLHELLTYLAQRGVITILVMAQHGLVGDRMESPVDASYLADGVIMLRYFETHGRLRRAISVPKKRSGRHEDTIRELRLSGDDGIQVSPPLEELHGVFTGVPLLTRSNGGD